MHIPKFIALVLVALSFSAAADFTTVTEAYEVNTNDLTMPINEGGTLKFRQCADCELQTLLVNSSTNYVLNGSYVSLQDFKDALASISDPIGDTATVLHHLESNMITAVKVRL